MRKQRRSQLGLSLVELLVAMALSVTVMGGVVSVLLSSKTNFITEQELATLQENARYAMKFLTDEIRMAGFSSCSRTPLYTANTINGASGNWFLDGTGIQGFEHEAGASSFPGDFKNDVLANTDALVIRRGDQDGYIVVAHQGFGNAATIELNKQRTMLPGQILVLATPDCEQVAIFQMSGPNSMGGTNSVKVVHNTGNSVSPGNCEKDLGGNFDCSDTSLSATKVFPPGSRLMTMSSKVFYVGNSAAGGGIPALFVRSLNENSGTATTAVELVQGVENLQILYGVDVDNDVLADTYMEADDVQASSTVNWKNVVSVKLSLRMRSINPVYMRDMAYPVFTDIVGSDGSDRYMREIISTTVQIRN